MNPVFIASLVFCGATFYWFLRRNPPRRAQPTGRDFHALFERKFRETRARRDGMRFRAATGADKAVRSLRRDGDRAAAALVALGYRELGEIVAQHLTEAPRTSMRTFIDSAGTTPAGVVVGGTTVRVWFASLRGDERFMTMHGDSAGLATRPAVHVSLHPATTVVAELHRAHVASVRLDEPGWVEAKTRDELAAQMNRDNELTLAWRTTQPPDDLLDADLRAMLGKAYERLGPSWVHRLRDEPPRATVHRG